MMAKEKTSQYAKPPVREKEEIIRQSQLERSIELFKLFEVKPTLREVLRLSQLLTDFQYTWEINNYELLKFEAHFKQKSNSDLLSSIPHLNADKPEKTPDSTKSVSAYQTSVAKNLKGKI